MSESIRRKTKTDLPLAGQILDYVRDRLVIFMPYLNRALLFMEYRFADSEQSAPGEKEILMTDGTFIEADGEEVIRSFRDEPDRLARVYLHMIFHCIFSHPFSLMHLDRELWDIASDIAAENAVLSLSIRELSLPDDIRKTEIIQMTEKQAGGLSAERIYHFLLSGKSRDTEEIKSAAEIMHMDGHALWMSGDEGAMREIYIRQSAADEFEKKVEKWIQLSQSAKTESLSSRKSMGEISGKRKVQAGELVRDNYDYTEFLKQFAVRTEELVINPDEFDYIYYTYGLELYDNMPLIEPLEYRDAMKIVDFVIAIDTSGSCQGYIVKRFLDKTWSLLKNSDIFPERFNLYLIECDSEIQKEIRITCEEDLDSCMSHFEIEGAGGTDFTPVFLRVNELLSEGAFHDLRGLIYFSDGLGKYPAEEPAYRTAFVSVGKGEALPPCPDWVHQFVLDDL